MQNLLPTLREEFRQKIESFEGGVAREVDFPDVPNKIMVSIGMRRVGKTFFVLQKIKALLPEVPLSRILYINFEDDRLFPMPQQKFAELLDAFYSLYPENHGQLCYLFLDEIQNVEQWYRVVRRFFDTKKVKIYLTGSSAKLLSKEIATSLRGRSLATEMWPFSFREFLQAKNITYPKAPFGKPSLDKLMANLRDYIEHGGFPEVTPLAAVEHGQVLQDYVSVVIFRDIIERYGVTNISLIRYLVNTLLKNVGRSFSINKLFNDLKSQAIPVSKTTLHDYLEHIEDAYLAFTLPLYSESLRKVQTNPKKIYAVDTGLARSYMMGRMQNIGRYFENLVYLDLRRRGHQVHYYLTKTRREVDFFTRSPQGDWHLYQVCWDMSDPKTYERESVALQEAENELGVKGTIITPETYLTSFLNTS